MIQLLFESITLAAVLRIDYPVAVSAGSRHEVQRENICCNSSKKQVREVVDMLRSGQILDVF